MKVVKIPPPVDCAAFLPGYDFADAYQAPVPTGVDAMEATRRAFAQPPGWATSLMALRDRIVAPFGLKPAPAKGFPVISETPQCVVLGFNDRHLDFRIVVTVADNKATMTTVVRRRNWFGRAYLWAIMPFHRLIAPAFATRIAVQ